ncbi:MAG: sugar ABC transporter ATP-binding protein [Ilumatobacteraceae bacterium]
MVPPRGAPPPVLDVRSLSKTYPGQIALADAVLRVEPGEVHALVGQNGSGKSTLIKLLGGYVQPDHGDDVRFGGSRIDLWSADRDVRRRIRIVHQDLGLVPTLSTVENLGLGRGYHTGTIGNIRWRHEVRRAQQLLLGFGLAPDVRRPVVMLSAAERAAVAIVRALQDWDDSRPGLLVLDEPTASLNRGEVDALFREVRRVADRGAGVLFVSHMIDEVLELADRITVLRDGRVVTSGEPVERLDARRLVELIVGRSVDDLYPDSGRSVGRPVLEAEMVYGVTLRGVSLKIHEGEVLGVAGLVGSGREEIAGALFGATPRFLGKVLVDKRKVFATPRDSIRAGIAHVPADRKQVGLDLEERLHEHVPLPRLGPLQRRGRLRHRAARAEAAEWIDRLQVQPPLLDRRMEKFSGGNQQKAVLARWLRTEPKVLLLDEPTQGVDVGAKASIYQRVRESAEAGMAILVASSDAEELVHLCDRVLVFRSGSVAVELRGVTLTEERLIAETLGATSHRKNMRVGREPVRVKVIRDDEDADVVEVPVPAGPEVVEAPARPAGRLARLVRAVLGGRAAGGVPAGGVRRSSSILEWWRNR